MKIRIKKRLNEGKGADIIAKGFYKDMINQEINKLSDNVKKVFDKFGGLASLLESNEEETVKQVAELAAALTSRYELANDSVILGSLHELYMHDIRIKQREWEKLLAVYIEQMEHARAEGKNVSFDEIMIPKETERHNKEIEAMYNNGPARLVRVIYDVFLSAYNSK